jgi:hypothetical protein
LSRTSQRHSALAFLQDYFSPFIPDRRSQPIPPSFRIDEVASGIHTECNDAASRAFDGLVSNIHWIPDARCA